MRKTGYTITGVYYLRIKEKQDLPKYKSSLLRGELMKVKHTQVWARAPQVSITINVLPLVPFTMLVVLKLHLKHF